jgi:pyrroline-5-carboxylate reductase
MTTVPQLPVPTWFVGCGNMGGAVVKGWRLAGLDLSSAVVIRPSGLPVEGVRTVTRYADAGASPRLVILAMKPQKLEEVTEQLGPSITDKSVIVSLLAGVEIDCLRQRFPNAAAVVRAMPNIPVAIRRGVIGLFSKDADETVRRQLSEIFAPLGFAPWMPDEVKLAAVGSVAGAGTAYVARFIDALRKAGEEWGLSAEIASVLALETVLGTAWLGATTRESMDDIVRRVASPNGTTEAGLAVLDRDRVLDQLIAVTIEAAARRGAELAAEAEAASLAGASQLH